MMDMVMAVSDGRSFGDAQVAGTELHRAAWRYLQGSTQMKFGITLTGETNDPDLVDRVFRAAVLELRKGKAKKVSGGASGEHEGETKVSLNVNDIGPTDG